MNLKITVILFLLFLGSAWLTYSWGAPNMQPKPAPAAETTAPVSEGETPEGTTPVELPGKKILYTRCSTCHMAPDPKKYTLYEWPGIIKRMSTQASLRESEAKQLYEYVESVQLDEEPAQ